MRKMISGHSVIRLLSLLTLACSAGIYCSLEEEGIIQGLCCSFTAAMTILMMYPLGYEDMKPSLVLSVPATLLFLALPPLSIVYPRACETTVLAALSMLLLYDYVRARTKLESVKMLFRLDSVWCSLEDYARKIYETALLASCAILLAMGRFGAGTGPEAILCLSMSAIYLLMYKRAWSGRTMLLSEKRESRIMDIIKGNLRSFPAAESDDEYLSALYARILDYMETCKPFLDPKYSLDDMSKDLFSNKVYLSRAVNFYSGRNFKQFVNYYRINYSIELMRSGQNLKIIQIALKSGFHSVVTYSMAFKIHTRKTPGEYIRDMEHPPKK
ncbi:MAG: AraC family transcriptional regulator [Bacteroidales bacterium]|nr:AraC family transcriptional regulator [Bacteroidales bacterium]